jgi:hypothetical protein
MVMLRSLLNGRVARFVVLSAAFVALSGLPAYAQTGGYYQHNQGSQTCQAGRRQHANACQAQPQQNQGSGWQAPAWRAPAQSQVSGPAQSPAHIPDDGNSK